MRTAIMVVTAILMLAACGEQKQDVKDTVFAPQMEALDKARAVRDTLKQGEQKTRAAIEASETPGTPAY